MPAFALSERAGPARRYDVIGQYATPAGRFVRHVALFNGDGKRVEDNEEVDVVHMGPPLQRAGKTTAHVLGSIPLTSGEIREIESWIAEVEDEYTHGSAGSWEQYVIHPPFEDVSEPNTKVRRYRRYSCAGFVLDSYRQVQIDLLLIDEQELPEVDQQAVLSAYPDIPNLRILQRFGLQGDGPWRIVLAGYVLHALQRTGDEIRRGPYRAKRGDERF